jgi:hypothetical protein
LEPAPQPCLRERTVTALMSTHEQTADAITGRPAPAECGDVPLTPIRTFLPCGRDRTFKQDGPTIRPGPTPFHRRLPLARLSAEGALEFT